MRSTKVISHFGFEIFEYIREIFNQSYLTTIDFHDSLLLDNIY